MAGSYSHCIDTEGRLLNAQHLSEMLENGGDVYEAVKDLFGMIWFLAEGDPQKVELARASYKIGLAMSPGDNGRLEDEE